MEASTPIFLYLHIPKTGGSTLGDILYEQYNDGSHSKSEQGYLHAGVYYVPDGFIRPKGEKITDGVLRAMRRHDVIAILGHFAFGLHRQIGRSARYMTMLRDPIERVLSLYHHLRTYDLLPAEVSVLEFVEGPYVAEANDDQVRRIAGIEPGVRCNHDSLKLAIQRLTGEFDMVGITERFDASILLAQRTFGWTQRINYLPRLVNQSRHSGASESTEVRNRIREYNRLDVELYDFANGLLDERIKSQGEGFPAEIRKYGEANRRLIAEHGLASTLSPSRG